ncbi:purine-nucleoside phosphorylase [Helicobacter enhydrae]|uniref:Purine-nucleoside phosphorylase n=1 Tax=Helicobacter enhydrae TaxID=222136 RepID=A0A1B1U5Y2_9HELI|nr:purine-nucleoside phosphorylase [Helicobacter enhydrae]ANV98160.1 purine-nucleoside phosphorylase [Helicobacter enhydrae]
MFVCAGNGEEFEFAQSIGVGLVESAIHLSKLCTSQQIDGLIFLGSAGSYDQEIPLLELFVSTHATQIDSSFLRGESYTPIPQEIKNLENVSYETIRAILSLNLPQAIVNSSNYISTDSVYASAMKERGILLENMEFFSVLAVARRLALPALGVFCVSNYCGSKAHQEFVSNRIEVIRRLKVAIQNL